MKIWEVLEYTNLRKPVHIYTRARTHPLRCRLHLSLRTECSSRSAQAQRKLSASAQPFAFPACDMAGCASFVSAVGVGGACESGHCTRRIIARRCSLRARRTLAMTSKSTAGSGLVDELLTSVRDTDRGVDMSSTRRARVETLIKRLGESACGEMLLDKPSLFGRYAVMYSSTSGDSGSPAAGGRFRTRWGRLFFGTRGLFQHVLRPDVVVNMVCFSLLGLLDGCVTLKGRFKVLDEEVIGRNGVQVEFERPRLALGKLVFEYGPKSSVKLVTTYLDERVRLGRGSRGGLFLFEREKVEGGMADEWNYIYNTKPLPTVLLPLTVAAFVLVVGFALWKVKTVAAVVITWLVMQRAQKRKERRERE